MNVLSLAERDKRRRDRWAAALSEVERRLRTHAHRCAGRYILYGSAARGDWRTTSDVDVLVDFPRELQLDGILFAESACAELGLRSDVRPIEAASDRLLSRAQAEGRILA